MLYFSNREKYNRYIEEINKNNIGKLSGDDKKFNHYAAARDINTEIKMLNFLNKHGIANYDELVSFIKKYKEQTEINNENISLIDSKIEKIGKG